MKKLEVKEGDVFGKLTIIKEVDAPNGRRRFLCRCECGNEKEVDLGHLSQGKIKTCGRCNYIEVKPGDVFGKWTVQSVQESAARGSKRKAECLCECGNIRMVACEKLTTGKSKSCGCSRADVSISPRLHGVWDGMKGRCFNPNDKKYKDYGGRGITVCNEWLGGKGFANFAEWAFTNGYDENAEFMQCTLDRIDVDGNYEPSNCRWISNSEQARNKRNAVYIDYNGGKYRIFELAEMLNVPEGRLRNRYLRGYSAEDITYAGLFDNQRRRA